MKIEKKEKQKQANKSECKFTIMEFPKTLINRKYGIFDCDNTNQM